MNARRLALAAVILLGVPVAPAQTVTPQPAGKPVFEIIRKFQGSTDQPTDHGPAAPADDSAATTPDKPAPKPAAEDQPATDEPPAKPEPDHAADPAKPEPTPPAPAVPPAEPRKGLAVRVEKLQAGTGDIDPSKVRLVFPFPAKPLSPTPAGWCLKPSSNAPPITREVELSPGNKITLSIRPDVLVPDADGVNVFNVPEPGFDPALGYHQNATIATILARSIRQLDHDAVELGTAIATLQQILVSLPKPEPRAEPVPEPGPTPDPRAKPSPARTR